MPEYRLDVNGRERTVEVPAGTPLLWTLRDELGLLGTKYGCGIGLCGACTVHLDGTAAPSCMVAVEEVGTARVTTIEGLSPDGAHPVQRAWIEGRVPQCGYCQAGQIMRAAALLAAEPDPDEGRIRSEMSANLCRCGTYGRILTAVRRAAELAREEA